MELDGGTHQKLSFDFYGVRLQAASGHAETLKQLSKDFAYFTDSSPGDPEPCIEIELSLGEPPWERLPKKPLLTWKRATLYNRGAERIVHYPEGALAFYDFRAERGKIFARSAALLHELGYLMIHSRIGQKLDQKGLHRVHALGFSHHGQGGVLLLPMGGGKTTLFMELLHFPEISLLGDDIPLLARSDGMLKAFPSRPGLVRPAGARIPPERIHLFKRRHHGDKYLVDLAHCRSKIIAAAPLRWVFVGERGSEPAITPCSLASVWRAFFMNSVLGLGTPQVLELLLPAKPFMRGAAGLLRAGASRLWAGAKVLRRERCYRFQLGPDPKLNAAALLAFLERMRGPRNSAARTTA